MNRRMRKQRRYKILFNLALMFLWANLLVLVGLGRNENDIVCSLVAGLLQFTLLAAFSWMLAQVLHIFIYPSKKLYYLVSITHICNYFSR